MKNIVEPDGPQMKIRRISIACWIPKATNILPEYAALIACLLQPELHGRTSVLRYTYIACLVII